MPGPGPTGHAPMPAVHARRPPAPGGIQQLICQFSLEFASIEAPFNIDFRAYFAELWPALEQMARDGLLELSREGMRILPPGRLLVRSVCMLFDRYLGGQDRQRFS